MKKFYPSIFLGILFFLLIGNAVAQRSSSPWWLGINGGAAWQKGDVRAKLGYGLGFTLEKSLLYNNTSAFGLSLRGRYLYSMTSGQDLKKSFGLANNAALNGFDNSVTNYASSLGYVYQNYKTDIHDFDLELVLNTNRLRARKGINLYVFGGLGYAGYKTSMNQLDAAGAQYNYNTVSTTDKDFTRIDLNALSDNTYETAAEGTKKRNYRFAPSFGAGISFRVVPNFYIGFEHKVTFPKTDLLDGQRWNNDNTLSKKNDLYHYSNMYFNIGLFGGSYTNTNTTHYTQESPVIELIQPTSEYYSATDCRANISMRVRNVSSRSGIEVRQDGSVIYDFEYNTSTGVVSINRTLTSTSVFVVTASNSTGNSSRSVNIQCVQSVPDVPAPKIDVLFPSQGTYTTSECAVEVKARLSNVTTKQNVSVQVDGRTLNSADFNFNVNTGILTCNVVSNATTVVVISAHGGGRADTKVINLKCVPPNVIRTAPAPSIVFLSPSASPFISVVCQETIVAKLRNISSKGQINVMVNNIPLYATEYMFNPTTQELTLNRRIEGSTFVQINAQNEGGKTSAIMELRCQPPVIVNNPPTIQITGPSVDPYISASCNEVIGAFVTNVPSKQNIQVYVNDVPLSPDLITYNKQYGQVMVKVPVVGKALVRIKVTTSTGAAADAITLICQAPRTTIPAPTVTIVTPSTSQYTSISCEEDVVAYVKNVQNKDHLMVTHDGITIPMDQYTFEPSTGKLVLHTLVRNTTVIAITAMNESGNASDNVSITCKPRVVLPSPPTVQFTYPITNPYTSVSCNENVEAVVKNVLSKNDIDVFVDGVALAVTNFTFDQNSGKITFPLAVKTTSTIIITVKNAAGTASDNAVITCLPSKPKVPAPAVQIISPSIDPYISASCEEDMSVLVRNVKDKSQINIVVNTATLNQDQFTFDANTGSVAFHVSIKAATLVVVTATNESGTASDKINLSCAPKKVTLPPTVQIVSPSTDPYVSASCEEDITVTVRNIKDKSKISITANGTVLATDQFSFDVATGTVAVHLSIQTPTVLVVTASNEAGSASDKISISCAPKKITQAPTVQILNPSTDPYISLNCEEEMVVTVRNVKDKSQINIVVNTTALAQDQFTFDAITGAVAFHVLVKTPTPVVITATNEIGTASDKITMSCAPKKVPQAPTVQILTPSTDPYISASCEEDVTVTVRNIKDKSKINILVNTTTFTEDQYTFDASTGAVGFHVSVKTPTTVVVTATNEIGTASDKITMSCAPKKVTMPPTVQILTPSTDPYISASCEEDVTVTVRNVKDKSQINIVVNTTALAQDQFTFDAITGAVAFHVLVKTPTTVVVTATNEIGTASDKITMSCAPKKVTMPPTVQILTPSTDPYISASCEEDVTVTVRNIKDKSKINILVNTTTLTEDQYTFDVTTGAVGFHVSVKTPTTVVVNVTNEAGTASDKITMNCVPPKTKVEVPTVHILTPSATPYESTTCNENVVVSVNNLTATGTLSVLINNVALAADKYTYNPNTKNLTIAVKIEKSATVVVSATNESGTASDQVVLICKPPIVEDKIVIPTFPEENTCPETSPQKYVDCASCHSSDDTNPTNITVEAGKKVSIRNNYTGQITMNGGMLVICGNAKPSSLNFNSGTIVINGEANFGSLNLNNANCTVRNFGKLTIQGTTFNGRMENYGTMTVGSDCNVNSQGVFKNTGTITIAGSINNGRSICNSGTMNVTGSLHNNGGASFINGCKVIIGKEFHNNSTFENTGYVKSSGKTVINGGSTFTMTGGSRLVAGSLDFNGTIAGASNTCALVSVSGQTTVNGAASLTGKVSLCDANGIEQNNSGGVIKSSCDCAITATSCVSSEGVVITTPETEEKVTICHKPPGNPGNAQTITVGKSAVKAHLDHGDHLGACTVDDTKEETNTPPTKIIDFVIDKGNVIPSQCFNATVKVLGCSIKENGVGADYPVQMQVAFGNSLVDPFGVYAGYTKSSNVNDGKTHEWNSPKPIPANTSVSVKAKSFSPRSSSVSSPFLFERNSGTNDPFVRVLRNGDALPKVPGFAGQADAETYMQAYISEGKMKLNSNQAIYLFELGTGSTSSASFDLQDCVVLVTLTPSESVDCEKSIITNPTTNPDELDANEKVTICHLPPGNTGNGQTITISKSALKAHLDHGDHLGACTAEELKSKEQKDKEEADRKQKEQEELERQRKAKEESDRIQRQKEQDEKDRKAKEEADSIKRVKDEADRKQKEQEELERQRKAKEEAEANEKITICHLPPGNTDNAQTITISKSALKAHLEHGDHIGPCTEEELNAFENKKKQEETDRQRKEKEEQDRIQKQKEEDERKLREKAEADRKEKEQAELERQRKEKEDSDRIQREKDEADRKQKEQDDLERQRKEQEEADRIQKQKDDEDRLRKAQEEEDRQQRERDEADRKQKQKDEQDRLRKEQEEADRIQKQKDEEDRLRRSQEDVDRLQREREEADRKQKQQDEQDRLRKEQDEADRIQKQKEDNDNKQREQEEQERLRKAQEDANRIQKQKENADNLRKSTEEAGKLQKAKEELERKKKADEAEQQRKLRELQERIRKAKEEQNK